MKTHAIIGGTSGIGGALARVLSAGGDDVWLGDDAGQQEAAPPGVNFFAMDLAGPTEPARFLSGIDRLDSLVIAASAMGSAALREWQVEAWDRSCAINLRLPFLAAQAAQDALVRGRGNIVLVSSTATLRGQPESHAYQASKAGLAGLLRSLAAELGPQGVRVNMVLPGWIETPQISAYWAAHPDADMARARINERIPLQRHGHAEEVAQAIAWLTSEAASYVSGAMIPLDGGDTSV